VYLVTQWWEQDVDGFVYPSAHDWEKGVGDEGNAGFAKYDILPPPQMQWQRTINSAYLPVVNRCSKTQLTESQRKLSTHSQKQSRIAQV